MPSEAQHHALTTEPGPGALVAGKYRVHSVLGRGGMGKVLSATNETTGKRVALKWILDTASPHSAQRFAREARAAGRIHHPNVVDVYDVVEHEGATCIVMEMLRGETLASLLGREKQLPIEQALEIVVEIARGIAAAHAAGVIHRDLKPANVFLCSDEGGPLVKILDFGISKLVEAEPTEITDTGVVLGTPQYLAPEQVRSAADVDHRADVYALGAILYEMLAGRPPHQNAHVPALLVEIATVAPRPLALARPEVPRSLSDLVGRAIAKDPDARFPTADAFVAAVRREAGLVDESGPRALGPLEIDTLERAPAAGASLATAETVAAPRGPARTPTAPTPASDERAPSRAIGRWPVVLGLALVLAGIAYLALESVAPPPTRGPSSSVHEDVAPPRVAVPSPEPVPPRPSIVTPSPPSGAPAVDDEPVSEGRRATLRRAPRARTATEGAVPEPEPEPEPSVVEVPAPTPSVVPPPSSPEPRAGRLGIDDL